jgi:hypothetical protein
MKGKMISCNRLKKFSLFMIRTQGSPINRLVNETTTPAAANINLLGRGKKLLHLVKLDSNVVTCGGSEKWRTNSKL